MPPVSQEGGNPSSEEVTQPAPPSKPTREAIDLASEVAVIAGHGRNLPRTWSQAHPPLVVQTWLNELAPIFWGTSLKSPADVVRCVVRHVTQHKKDGPPHSPRYFAPAVRKMINDHTAMIADLRKARKAAA